MAFGINATVNLLGMMGRYAFQAAVSGMQNALNDGLGVGDAIGHFWGKLNTESECVAQLMKLYQQLVENEAKK